LESMFAEEFTGLQVAAVWSGRWTGMYLYSVCQVNPHPCLGSGRGSRAEVMRKVQSTW
jgi:hypothetical protein